MVKGHVVARSVGLVGSELAVPAAARAVPDRVAEGMMGQHEDGLVRVFRLRGGQAFANPVLPVAVPAVVVAARMGRERQHVVAAASAHDEIAVGLALVRASRNLERSRYGQLGGKKLLERSLGVLLVSLPAVVFVVAHYDPNGLARVRVEERGQLIVLRGRAGVRRIAHEEVGCHIGRGGVDPGKRSGDLLRVGVAGLGAYVRVAVHGEAHVPVLQRGPSLAGGRAERCVGVLIGEHEHASRKGHAGYGC